MKRIIIICSVIAGLATVIGIGANLDSRYAKAATVERVEDRLERKIINDRMDKLQERMWFMEDRWAEKFIVKFNRSHDSLSELLNFMTPEARDQYRLLQKEYAKLEKQLEEVDDE